MICCCSFLLSETYSITLNNLLLRSVEGCSALEDVFFHSLNLHFFCRTTFVMHKVLAAAIDSNILSASESFIDQCCAQNIDYARTYDEKIYDVRAPPSKHLAVVCCMDARLDVFRMLGLKPGDAHIIRNGKAAELISFSIFPFRFSGGGRIRDAVRSLVCSQTLLQTKEVMIIHHTDCGFTYFSNNDQVIAALKVVVQSLYILISSTVLFSDLFSCNQGQKSAIYLCFKRYQVKCAPPIDPTSCPLLISNNRFVMT